jgi:hypothetical protein
LRVDAAIDQHELMWRADLFEQKMRRQAGVAGIIIKPVHDRALPRTLTEEA